MSSKQLKGITTNSFVVEGAKLECTMGMVADKLEIPIGHGVYIRGKKQANVSDSKSQINICSFGNCSMGSQPVPCIPVFNMEWLNGKNDVEIDGSDGLLNTSILICSKGGLIKIKEDGQM